MELELLIEPLWQSRDVIQAQRCDSLRSVESGQLGVTSLPALSPIHLSTSDTHAGGTHYSLDTAWEDGFNVRWDALLFPTSHGGSSSSTKLPLDAALFSSTHSASAARAANSAYTTASYTTPYRVVHSVPITLSVAPEHVALSAGAGSNDRVGFWRLSAALSAPFLTGGGFQMVLRSTASRSASSASQSQEPAVVSLCSQLTSDEPCVDAYVSQCCSPCAVVLG
jgi:hypothetical protein